MSIDEPPPVTDYRQMLETFLTQLSQNRKQTGIEPPVSDADCTGLIEQIQEESSSNEEGQLSNFAALETVFREIFVGLIATSSITEPSFVQLWILLDVVNILSDHDLCESGLQIWLVEDLLDSQTIEGCRRIFDYLESRRERITAKNFKTKSLAILRCCNELLRRLSRAEDTVFCGRVFIFMFQSFPLGDRSSVNLRGEFHVENITTFDPAPQRSEDAIKPMEIDSSGAQPIVSGSGSGTPASVAAEIDRSQTTGRSTPAPRKDAKAEEPVDLDALYPKFWSLQAFFSNPTKLFDSVQMNSFKEGLSATLSCFQKMSSKSAPATRPDGLQRGIKRKRSEMAAESSTFNPKYLTNRDLFDLEVHDIAFRRHILVQALIMIDFLLGLTPAAKTKLAGLTNQSVLYSYTLSPEDAKWATSTKASIAEYLQQGPGTEGILYYRMVGTVLSRDKNWVRWKAENCPSISRDPVEVNTQLQAQKNLQKLCAKQPLPPPPGAADLDFLSKSKTMESLADPSKYQVPSMQDFYTGIMNDELDAEMGTEEEIAAAKEAAQAKLWRALRASGRRFYLCEKIENGKNLKALVGEEDKENQNGVEEADGEPGVGEARLHAPSRTVEKLEVEEERTTDVAADG